MLYFFMNVFYALNVILFMKFLIYINIISFNENLKNFLANFTIPFIFPFVIHLAKIVFI